MQVLVVAVEVGTERRHFTIMVEEQPLGEHHLQVITGAPTLQRELHNDLRLDTAIRKLVGRRYNGNPVTLPTVVGQLPEGTFAPAEPVEQV